MTCYISITVRAFDLIPTLRARPQYQLSSGSLVLEDYPQQNRWDYPQQNQERAALGNLQIDTLDPNFDKTTMTTEKTKYTSYLVRSQYS